MAEGVGSWQDRLVERPERVRLLLAGRDVGRGPIPSELQARRRADGSLEIEIESGRIESVVTWLVEVGMLHAEILPPHPIDEWSITCARCGQEVKQFEGAIGAGSVLRMRMSRRRRDPAPALSGPCAVCGATG